MIIKKSKKIPLFFGLILIIAGVTIFLLNSLIKVENKIFVDKTSPTISMKGDANIKIELFSTYTDAGATAKDNVDGDLTANIVSTNDVKTNRIGIYHVNYSVADKKGNKAVTERTVEVLAPSTNNTNGIPILMYHFFYDSSKGETPENSNFTEISMFDQQMKYLVDNSYYFPTWTELSDYLDGKLNLPQKSIIITVDDGSSTFFNEAYPVLDNYQIPATSFLITSWSGNPDQFNVDRNLISFQSHSHAMHEGGCTGGHGGKMLCIDYQAGLDDLNTSIQLLGSNDAFCYPFGDYNETAIQMLNEAGFKIAVTTEWGNAMIGQNKLAIPRIRISGGISMPEFIANIQ